MPTSTFNNFWIEFIGVYKSLPELWKTDCEDYGNKYRRERAYEKILKKYKEIDKSANILTCKRKINNLRTCYRRELNKMRRSGPNVYVPTLWYFNHMTFLKDQEDDEGEADKLQANPSKKRKQTTIVEPIHKTDKAKTLSAAWELLYRDLEPGQQLYANRMIMEVLYEGALGKLHASSYKILQKSVNEHDSDDSDDQTSVLDISESYLIEAEVQTGDTILLKKKESVKKPSNNVRRTKLYNVVKNK